MARPLNKLSPSALRGLEPGKHCDGGGLWFVKRPDGGAQWMLRVTVHRKRREMGLGPYPEVSLKDARAKAEVARKLARNNIDPIKERVRQHREAERRLHVLRDVALDAFESRKAELKGDGTAGRWFSPLELHVLPKLGGVPVSEIDQIDIRNCLAPIWHDKADTARKAMNRLNICFKHAAALGLDVDLQATDKAKALLGKQRHTAQHIPAMPWVEVPMFYQSLDGGTIVENALRLLILTAVRSAPLRHMRLEQMEGNVWTIPGELMKGRKGATGDFQVPLSREALNVIEAARPLARDGWLFPSVRKGVISDMTMSKFMSRWDLEARPHGFRSSFRDWVAETTSTPREVAETALGHVSGGAVERAYRRTDFFEQRSALMERWADWITGQEARIVAIR